MLTFICLHGGGINGIHVKSGGTLSINNAIKSCLNMSFESGGELIGLPIASMSKDNFYQKIGVTRLFL
jgi:hypothetical protein